MIPNIQETNVRRKILPKGENKVFSPNYVKIAFGLKSPTQKYT
jgi:hypothetical protein